MAWQEYRLHLFLDDTYMQLELNKLEKAVLDSYLTDKGIGRDYFGKDFEDLEITERRITGSGYMIELKTKKSLAPKGITKDRGAGNIIATINSGIKVGFVVYVDDGKLNALEGSTLGERWPEQITDFTVKNA